MKFLHRLYSVCNGSCRYVYTCLQKLSKNVQDALARANEVAEEVFSSMRTIRSFANESEEVSRYADKLNATYKLKLKESVAYAGYMWSNQVLIAITSKSLSVLCVLY